MAYTRARSTLLARLSETKTRILVALPGAKLISVIGQKNKMTWSVQIIGKGKEQ